MGNDEFEIENQASVDLVPSEGNQLLASQPTDSVQALEKVKAVTQTIDGAVKLALARTHAQDWVKMGNNYYLQASGVEKVRSVFGIYIRDKEIIREELPDGHFAYICMGKVGSKLLDSLYGETTIEIEGSRSSADGFFSKSKQLDPMDVRKSAYANFQVRGCKAILGLGNMTANDLAKMGVNVSAVAGVTYKKSNQGGSVNTAGDTDTQNKLYNNLIAICGSNDQKVLEDKLEELTAFEGKDGPVKGVRSLKALKGKRLSVAYGKTKKLIETKPEEEKVITDEEF